MRRAVLVGLVVTGVAAALVVTGSSTMRQATAAGMGVGLVPGALVALLEVVNIAGTWTWLTDERTHVQVEAAAAVTFASSVSGVCGVLTYNLLGLVAPAGLLVAVHLLNRLTAPAAELTDEQASPELTAWASPAVPSEPPASSVLVAAEPAPVLEPVDEPLEPEPAAVPEPESAPVLEPDDGLDARVREIAELLAAGADVTGPQAAALHGVSERTGRRLLADARAHLETADDDTPGALRLVTTTTEGQTA